MVSEGPRADEQAVPTGAPIQCKGLVKIFRSDGAAVTALQGLDLEVAAGDLVAVLGPSGSGKSTLMNILAGLDVATKGQVTIGDVDLATLSAGERVRYRRDVVGFVSQQNTRNLMPYLTATENVALPLSLRGVDRQVQAQRAGDLLGRVGLSERSDLRPGRLSAGEQQRLAIAVALANRPRVLLADEPTGALDSPTAIEVVEVFRAITIELGVTGLIATADVAVSAQANRTITIGEEPEAPPPPGHAPWTMPLSTSKPGGNDHS